MQEINVSNLRLHIFAASGIDLLYFKPYFVQPGLSGHFAISGGILLNRFDCSRFPVASFR